MAKSIQVFPSGSNNFRDSQLCAGYLEIQDPLLAEPNPPGYDVAVRVLDRRTGEEKAGGGFVAGEYMRPGIPHRRRCSSTSPSQTWLGVLIRLR